MSVNGITNSSAISAYDNNYTTPTKATEVAPQTPDKNTTATETNNTGVVYEPSEATKKTYKPNQALIDKLKADAEARTANLKSIVEQMLTKQGTAYNNANDMWKILSSGNFTVDAATKAQAQEDISEDGYWGVKQTSERILDFAKALTGGDPEKIEEMREAFKKGYEDAQKTWGGELPDICKETYDAVFKGFDAWAAEANSTTVTEAIV